MRITLKQPDDWHLHLRDGARLGDVVGHSAATFARAIVMPNLKPPVSTVERALAYRRRILDALGDASSFEPLMALYLTPDTTPAEVQRAARCEHVVAMKLYPAGATTNSEAGVTSLDELEGVFESMQRERLPLLVHGESTRVDVDVFDREAVFVEETLTPLAGRFPELRIVLEHVTTREGVAFVEGSRPGVAATITAHHLLHSRNALFEGGIRPDYFCLPVLKREHHRQALLAAATSGSGRFFLGTDSAPHARTAKRSACGCAGIYTAHAALPLYAHAFEQAGALDRLEGFASIHGADFYGLPTNPGTVELVKQPWRVPERYPFADDELTPLCAGETLSWRVRRDASS